MHRAADMKINLSETGQDYYTMEGESLMKDRISCKMIIEVLKGGLNIQPFPHATACYGNFSNRL